MFNIVEVRNLEKQFTIERFSCKSLLAPFTNRDRICVLKNVPLHIQSGEIVGIVGPNGAGKTTLLRVLADLLEVDGGSVTLCGHRLGQGNHYLRGKIGYVPSDDRGFFWRLTGRENLEFFGSLYEIPYKEICQRIRDLLQSFQFEKQADRLFDEYSAGMRRKIAIMRALIHRPNVLLLDEITNNLDPESCNIAKCLVKKYILSREGSCAIWSTHRSEEIKEICDKVVVIKGGSVQFYGTINEFSDLNITIN